MKAKMGATLVFTTVRRETREVAGPMLVSKTPAPVVPKFVPGATTSKLIDVPFLPAMTVVPAAFDAMA